MKFIPAFFAALALLCLAPACKKAPEEKTAAPPTPAPVDPRATPIGFLAPLTGPQASFGNDAINGAKLALDEINAAGGVLGRPLRLAVRDTRSSPEETAFVTADLLDKEKPVVVIGEIASDRTLIAAPMAQARGVPLITPGSTNDTVTAAGDFIFRTCYTDSFQAAAMAKFARSIDVTKAAILFDPANPYSSGLTEAFKQDFAAGGGQIVAEASYRAGDKDFTAQLNALKAASPEIIFLPSYYAEAALIIRQARDLGLDLPFIGTDGWDSPDFLKVGGSAVNNCYFSSHFSPENKTARVEQFTAAYTAKYNAPPPPLAALAYDAVRLAADALKRANSKEGAPVRDALAAVRDLPGVTGVINFDANRNPTKPAVVLRVADGRFTYLETTEPPAPPAPIAPAAVPAPAGQPASTTSPSTGGGAS